MSTRVEIAMGAAVLIRIGRLQEIVRTISIFRAVILLRIVAGAGEVLVSRTVTDLVVGSGLQFEDRGEHELKGVPGKWEIYAVTS